MILLTTLLSAPFTLVLAAAEEQPGHRIGWQDSPDRRGTWEIITSCATTVLACTWSVQHLNVPGPARPPSKSLLPARTNIFTWLSHGGAIKNLVRSCKWMVITILFPEFIMAHAFFELVLAVQATEMVAKLTPRKCAEYPWLIGLFFFRNRVPGSQQEQDNPAQDTDQQEPEWTITHSYFANMGGLLYRDGEGVQFPLTAFQYAKEHEIYSLPTISEEDIKDKAKQDVFAKCLAVLQLSQLALSLIVRAFRSLPFSQLETLTLGLAVCGAGTYIVYWYKPQGVGAPIVIRKRNPSYSPIFSKTYDSFWKILTNTENLSDTKPFNRVKNDNIPMGTSQTAHVAIPVLAVMSAAFGCFHLIAWDFEFPTDVEKLLWRIATVLSIIFPVIGLATIPLAQIAVRAGNPRDFMRNCLHLLRELSWNFPEADHYLQATRELENIYCDAETNYGNTERLYRDILTDQGPGAHVRSTMLDFIERKAPFEDRKSLELPKEFQNQFKVLMERMQGLGPKNLVENAKTNVFPQKSLLPKDVNLFILYTTSSIYCLSRLTIMALALSSLRSMADEVYVTTWTKNIPAVQ